MVPYRARAQQGEEGGDAKRIAHSFLPVLPGMLAATFARGGQTEEVPLVPNCNNSTLICVQLCNIPGDATFPGAEVLVGRYEAVAAVPSWLGEARWAP